MLGGDLDLLFCLRPVWTPFPAFDISPESCQGFGGRGIPLNWYMPLSLGSRRLADVPGGQQVARGYSLGCASLAGRRPAPNDGRLGRRDSLLVVMLFTLLKSSYGELQRNLMSRMDSR